MKKTLSVIVVAALLSGCASIHEQRAKIFRDRGNDYLTSDLVAPLRVPAGVPHPGHSDQYPLPNAEIAHHLDKVNLEPPGFGKALKDS